MNNNIIVFDLETTADDAHDITEIGAVALNSKLEVIDRFSELVNIR
jgi:DNA polymerase III epsilon subunit-like protein